MKIRLTLQRQIWFALFGVALLLAFGWVATRSGPLAPTRVTVTRVVQGEVAPALFGIGVVEAQRAYFIGPTTAARVRRVLVDVGDKVRTGQLLAEMDPVDLDERVVSASAAAARASNAVAAAQAGERDASGRQKYAAAEARRYRDLGQRGLVSQSVVDGKLQEQQSADAQRAAATASLAGARRELARLDADLRAVEQQRENIRLAAPVDGVVTARDAEPGSTVIAGQSVLKLEDPTSLWVTVRLDQGRSRGLQVGLPAEITLRSDPRKTLTGKVARVEPISDSVTEERLAKVAFEVLPQSLSTGEMAEVTLHLPGVRNALIVPNASVRYRGSQAGVWQRLNGRLRFVAVTLGAESLDGKVQIVEGVAAGDEVVVYSERDLQGDSHIKVVSSLAGKLQ